MIEEQEGPVKTQYSVSNGNKVSGNGRQCNMFEFCS